MKGTLVSSSAFFPLLFNFSSTICAELNFDYEKSIQIATFCLFLKKVLLENNLMNFAMCEKTLTNIITNAKSSNRFVSFFKKEFLATYLTMTSKVEKLLHFFKSIRKFSKY